MMFLLLLILLAPRFDGFSMATTLAPTRCLALTCG